MKVKILNLSMRSGQINLPKDMKTKGVDNGIIVCSPRCLPKDYLRGCRIMGIP